MHPLNLFQYIILAALLTMLFRVLVHVARRDTLLGAGRVIQVPLMEVAVTLVLLLLYQIYSPPTWLGMILFVPFQILLTLIVLQRRKVAWQPLTAIPSGFWRMALFVMWLALAAKPIVVALAAFNQWLFDFLEVSGEGQSIPAIFLYNNELHLIEIGR